jgi:cell division protein FtsL
MSRLGAPLIVAICVACLLVALSVVAWRQGRAREVITERERLHTEIVFEQDERTELEQRIRYLESRRRIRTLAEEMLDLRQPKDGEFDFLTLEES